MNCNCSDSVLLFLEYSYIDKILLRKDIINGVLFALNNTTFFHADYNCIKNILIFLEIEGSITNQLLLDLSTQKGLKIIIEFLEKNENQILRKSL